MDCHKNLWTSFLPSVGSRSKSSRQHTRVSSYIWRRGYLLSVWQMRIQPGKASHLSSQHITEYSVFILPLLVSIVFLFNALFNLPYTVSQFAILKLIVGVLPFAPLCSFDCHFNSLCSVFVTPANILKPKLSSNIISSTSSPSYTQTQPCFFACQLMSRLN